MSKTHFKGQIKLPVVSQLPNRAKLKFIALQNLASDVYEGATSYFDCDENGNYDFEVYVGKHLFSMTSDGMNWTKPIEVIVEPLAAGLISIELSDLIDLQALPTSDDVLVEYRALLQEMKIQRQQSEAAKTAAENAANDLRATVNTVNSRKIIQRSYLVSYTVHAKLLDKDGAPLGMGGYFVITKTEGTGTQNITACYLVDVGADSVTITALHASTTNNAAEIFIDADNSAAIKLHSHDTNYTVNTTIIYV